MLGFTQAKNMHVNLRQTRALLPRQSALNPYDNRMELDSSWTKVAGKRVGVVYRKMKSVIHRLGNAVNKLYTSS